MMKARAWIRLLRLPALPCTGQAAPALALAALLAALPATRPRAESAAPAPAPAGQTAPAPAAAPPILTADSIRIERDAAGNARLIAEGNVEAIASGTRLRAARIVYGQARDILHIEGPIVIENESGETMILADQAALSADLRNGLMQGARLVLSHRLQIAAAEIRRVDGRYTQLYKSVASSCQVCRLDPVPLWEIRARRVIHDQQERQLHFENAQLRVLDIPVFWLPRLRLPDPTLKRATGFLVPKMRSTSKLGFGIKAPYFITMGRYADLLLTPYLSAKTTTLEYRLRKNWARGEINLGGAFSRDDLRPGETRSFLFGTGGFDLPRDFRLDFGIETVSDPAYLLEYEFSDKDRLETAIDIHRARRDSLIRINMSHFRSLRAGENNDTLPSLVSDSLFWRRMSPALIGGQLDFRLESHGHYRSSDVVGDPGRDMGRFTARLDWRRSGLLKNGMVLSAMAGLAADSYIVRQDPAWPETSSEFAPYLGAELRWPMRRSNQNGSTDLIEPVLQLYWSESTAPDHPNEDSTLVEFDEGNLFALSRFPGADRREEGLRANIGLTWRREDPSGRAFALTVGRVLRERDLGQFAPASGLSGSASDWLVMGEINLPRRNLSLANRALFNDDLSFTRNETLLTWRNARFDIASGYIWEAQSNTSEWVMDGAWRLNDYWRASASWRYDFDAGRAARAAAGLQYRNECISVDFSLSRRFTSSASVEPTTRFDMTVALIGFGTGPEAGAVARRCRRIMD